MSCWQVLDLAPHSDPRTIKRRYAELLKVFRPDADPVAFQRLRDAYEQALFMAKLEPAEAPLSEDASEIFQPPVPARRRDDQHWLHQLLANLGVDDLDDALLTARQHDGQALFEQQLLERCLAPRDDAPALAAWALEQLQWLTPWQTPTLPQARLDALAHSVLRWHLAELASLLDAGEEREAQACVQRFYRQPWMQAVDRSLSYTQALVDWMLANQQVTTDFFLAVAKVFGWDERIERLPISPWQRESLLKRPDVRWFSKKIDKLLQVSEPRNTEESAAWMLYQELDVVQRRRLADNFIELDWMACEQMQRVARSQPTSTWQAPGNGEAFDWQRYRHGQRWPGAYAWLLVFCVLAFALVNSVPHALQWTRGGGVNSTVGFVIESCMSGAVAALLLCGLHGAWNWLARQLTASDIALGQRLLPASISCAGAGLLPLRNGVPCIGLGLLLGSVLAGATALSALPIAAFSLLGGLLPLAYVLLQFFRPSLRAPRLSLWLRANFEGVVAHAMWIGGVLGLGLMLWFSSPR